ncbi:Macrophage migration inhibitory factor [Phytophthora cinnamomi]|uniref:Macrophage migration inhibitory factor n=1 Tax=Phytophthora cinnamomi TaxID=4785 RepID=UPI003559B5AA|nr:Macrophage migration inhibitory factor [Phytophthora cinnamomi]
MPYASITSNVLKSSVDKAAASAAVAKTLEESFGFPAVFMMVELNLEVPMFLQLNEEPAAYVHARCIGRIDAERNPKTIAALTKTVSEQLKVPAERIYVVLEDITVGNWGAAGTTVIPPTK